NMASSENKMRTFIVFNILFFGFSSIVYSVDPYTTLNCFHKGPIAALAVSSIENTCIYQPINEPKSVVTKAGGGGIVTSYRLTKKSEKEYLAEIRPEFTIVGVSDPMKNKKMSGYFTER